MTFDAKGGVGGKSELLDYGAEIVVPEVSRTGYSFTGWSPEVAATVPVDGATYTAQWQINKYTVTFDANGGEGGWSQALEYDSAITAPEVSRTGYTFAGWSPDVAAAVPVDGATYTAQWTPNKYLITFDANGGEGRWSEAMDYDCAITAPTVSRTGYTFVGWSPAVAATVPVGGATYTAQWRINKYTVTFDANGGTGSTSQSLDYGTEITAPTVSRTGYTFVGWSPAVAATVPVDGASYTAQWSPMSFTVSFDPNGGDMNGAAGSKVVVFDAAYGALPTPVLEFCDFAGWTLNGSPVTASTIVATAADHTLVAQWHRWGARIAPEDIASGETLRDLYPDDYAAITTVVFEEGIPEIPAGFFDGCGCVEALTLPESLETLGIGDLPAGIRASLDYGEDGFIVYGGWVLGHRDSGAAHLAIPEGIVGIGTRAFAEFWDMETVEMPDSVRRIGREAFHECTYLDCVDIPDSVETIAAGAFDNCSWMQTMTVGGGVRKVSERAFSRCASLLSVVFADGLESVGECAFSNDWRLLSVSLPHSVTNVGVGAFAKCRGVKGVTVPANVATLAELFPAAYSGIESVMVAAGETDIMEGMFAGCAALADLSWADGVTNIGARAFFGCASLEAVGMPDSVRRIGASAFEGCSALHDLTLSRSLEALPARAFAKCVSLDSFVVPASVASLGNGIVAESGVSALYCLGNAPSYVAGAYSGILATGFTTYVVRGTRGWDGTPSSRVLPEFWTEDAGYAITYWTPNRFDATFDANGGHFRDSSVTQWAEEQITDMGYVLPNQDPARPGYAFDGWWTEPAAGAEVSFSTRVTATRPLTLYAHWRSLGNLVVATFNANGGTAVVPGSQNYVAGQTFGEFPVPSRRGYGFRGWWTAATGGEHVTEASQVPAADVELFAHWEPVRYFVAFDANGGTGAMTVQEHIYDARRALSGNQFTRDGHAFAGWSRSANGQVEYADGAEVVNLCEVAGETVRLYAVWGVAGYNVAFDANGGTGVMENQTIALGETQNLHTNEFQSAGRAFVGWAETSAGEVAHMDGEAVRDLCAANGETRRLYAVWRTTNSTWRVTFDANGGSVAPGHWNVARGASLNALPLPTRPGFAFIGWRTRRDGGEAVVPPFAVESDMALHARWRSYDDPLPPVAGDTGVAAVMGDSTDLELARNIKTVKAYDALVDWADENGISHQAVRESMHVWESFALGAEALFENEPEITIVGMEMGETGRSEIAPYLAVTVVVRDGDAAALVSAEKVATMFEATSNLRDWDGAAKLEPIVTERRRDPGGTLHFTVVPGDGKASSAFLRIKVK